MTNVQNYILIEMSERYSYYDDLEYIRRITELENGGHIWQMTNEEADAVRRYLSKTSAYNNYSLARLIPPCNDAIDRTTIMDGVQKMLAQEQAAEERKARRAAEDAEKKRQKLIEREAKKLAKDPALLAAVIQQMENKQ